MIARIYYWGSVDEKQLRGFEDNYGVELSRELDPNTDAELVVMQGDISKAEALRIARKFAAQMHLDASMEYGALGTPESASSRSYPL